MRYIPFIDLEKRIQGHMMLLALDDAINNAGDSMCWLDFGTLMGCAKTGTFHKHDYDVDVSVMEGWWPPSMDDHLQKQGFEIVGDILVRPDMAAKYLVRQPLEPCQYLYSYRGISLSVWVYFDGVGQAFKGPSKVCFGWHGREPYETPDNLLNSFVLREFPDGGGAEFYIPEQHIEYLSYIYGERWRVDDIWEMSIVDRKFLKQVDKYSEVGGEYETLNYQHCIADY